MVEQIHSSRSCNVVRDIKSTIRRAGHVASNGAKRNIHRVPVTKSEGKKRIQHLGVDGRKILRYILNKRG